MNSYEFNELGTLSKLKAICGEDGGDFTLEEIADLINSYDQDNTVRLVMFLNKEDQAGGCPWCGG